MKIVHISTSKTGGAGIIAARLSEIQKKSGHDSSLILREYKSTLLRKMLSKALTFFSIKIATARFHQITPLSYSNFDYDTLRKKEPDIVYIHNWFNFLNIKDITNITQSFKTIFVLHDERLLTGGCHVTLGCDGYLGNCHNCPATRIPGITSKNKIYLNKQIEKFGSFAVVSPSEWLSNKVATTFLGKASAVSEVIPNPVSTITPPSIKKFKKFESTVAEALFVTNDISIPYKGLDLLLQSLQIFDIEGCNFEKLNLTIIGAPHAKEVELGKAVNIRYRNSISISKMSELYSKSHFLLVPSSSENHPGVVNEAQLSGLVVIATDVGGISEMITDSVSGFLAKNSPTDFRNAIHRALSSSTLEQIVLNASSAVKLRTNEETIITKHNKVIADLLNA